MTSQFYARTLQCCVTENIIHRKLDGRGTHTKIRIRACRWNEYIPWHGTDNQRSDSKKLWYSTISHGDHDGRKTLLMQFGVWKCWKMLGGISW